MEIEKKFDNVAKRTPLQIIYFNFVGGLSWGLGTVLGATVMIGLLGLFVSRSRNIPFVGDITDVLLEEIQSGQQSFRDQFSPDNGEDQDQSTSQSSKAPELPTSYTMEE